MCYNANVKNRVEFAFSALKTLTEVPKSTRRLLLEGIRVHLIENDPLQTTRNKFPLRRPSRHAERELRLENWRVSYTVIRHDSVLINLIGEKRNEKLFVHGEEIEL